MMTQLSRSIQLVSVRWWNASAYYAVSLADILTKTQHTAIICGKKDSPPLIRAASNNIPVYNSIDLENKNPFKLFTSYNNLLKLINSRELHIINAHRPEDHIMGAFIKKKLNIPLIRTVGDVRSPRNNPINKWLHLQATDHFIFSCQANKKKYKQILNIPEEKCTVIYAAVDTNYFDRDQTNRKIIKNIAIDPKKTIFGLIARLSPIKDHLTFLKAAAILLKKYKNVEFVISGKEVEISHIAIHKLATDLGINQNVHILDEVDDIRNLINIIDVGVVCSKGSEVICRIAAEYLSMSKPLIVTKVNVLPEMVTDKEEGFIVPPESPQVMADKMALLLNTELLQLMRKKARKKAISQFSLEKMLQDTLIVYRKWDYSGSQFQNSRSRDLKEKEYNDM